MYIFVFTAGHTGIDTQEKFVGCIHNVVINKESKVLDHFKGSVTEDCRIN